MRIRPDDAGFSNEAEKGILSKVGGIASKAAGVFAAGFVAKQGFDFLGGLVKDASESRRVLAETEQAIKATGGVANVSSKDVTGLADALSRKTGIDDEQIQSAENLLLTFKGVRNEAGKGNDIFNQSTRAVLDLSKQFGGVEQSAIQVGKALNDPVAGITALGRAGVTFTDQQKDQIKALVETGDTLGAQKIILGEINAQVGGQAAAQATAADKLKVVWGNLREELGTRLLPIVDKVATFLADRLPGALDATGRFLGPIVDQVGAFVKALTTGFTEDEGTPIERFALTLRNTVFPVVVQVFNWIRDNIKPVLLGVAAAFLLAAGPVAAIAAALVLLYTRFQVVRDIINFVVEAYGKYVSFLTGTVIPAVLSFVRFLVDQFSHLADFVRENWAAIQEAIGHVIVAVRAIIDNFVSQVQLVWRTWGDELLNIVRIVWDQIRNIVETVVGIIRNTIKLAVDLINGDWGKAWDDIKGILSTAWDFIVETVTNALRLAREVVEGGVSAIVAVVGGVPGQIKDKLESLVGFMADVGERAVRAMAAAIGNAIHWVLDKAGDLVSKVKDKLTFWDSPPELFGLHVGQRLVRGMADGLSQTRILEVAAAGVVSAVKDAIDPSEMASWMASNEGGRNRSGIGAAEFSRNSLSDPNRGRSGWVQDLDGRWTPESPDGSLRGWWPSGATTGASNGTMILSITGPLVNVEGSIIPGQEEAVAAAAEGAVLRMVRNGTVGREMSNRTAIISRR